MPAATTNIDVRWHVHVMREAWLKIAQAIGRSVSAFRVWRSFDSMDVEMIRERMARVHLLYRIERGVNLLGAGIRLTFKCPLVPRPKVHHRFPEQRTHINVIREFLPDFAHRVGISLV